MANILNDFTRGDTVTFTLTIKQDGTPIDITGSSFTFTMKKKPTEATTIIQNTGTITDAVNGQVLFKLTPTETNIDAGMYYYDIEWVDAGSNVTTLVNSTITVKQDVNTV